MWLDLSVLVCYYYILVLRDETSVVDLGFGHLLTYWSPYYTLCIRFTAYSNRLLNSVGITGDSINSAPGGNSVNYLTSISGNISGI